MSDRARSPQPASSTVTLAVLFAFGAGLGGCANMSDTLTSAFADPAKYDLYDCRQLQAERKRLTLRAAELRGLMAKADTGTGGSVVSEVAYRNDAISTRASSKLADEVWDRNKCVAVAEKPNAVSGLPPPTDDSRILPPQLPKPGGSLF